MSRASFVDLSSFNAPPDAVDWQKYKQWSASSDGISRVCLRSSYGTGNSLVGIRAIPAVSEEKQYRLMRSPLFGVTDAHFHVYRAGALAAGIDQLILYHYAYPQLNSPQAEAAHQAGVLGPLRANDLLMLDIEENVTQATAQWCYEWLVAQQKNYPNNQIILYSFPAFIAHHLQDSRLAAFPLALASWQYSPDETPPCPSPWTSYAYIQWTDKATSVPGIPGIVDADVYIQTKGVPTMTIPQGWKDDGTTLLAPNGIAVRNGFRLFVLNNAWDPNDYPLGPEMVVAVLEMSNPGLGGGTQQMFRYSMLGWNAQVGVIHEWIGAELMAVRVALSAAQTALKDAQTQLTQCKTTLQVTGQQLQQATAALSASPAYGVACNTIADLVKSLPRYPVTTAGTLYHANEEAS